MRFAVCLQINQKVDIITPTVKKDTVLLHTVNSDVISNLKYLIIK